MQSAGLDLPKPLDPPKPPISNEPGPPRGHHSVGKRKPSPKAFSTPITTSIPRHCSHRARFIAFEDRHRTPSTSPIVAANSRASDRALAIPWAAGSSAFLISGRFASVGVKGVKSTSKCEVRRDPNQGVLAAPSLVSATTQVKLLPPIGRAGQ
jgi:hypothetical protein